MSVTELNIRVILLVSYVMFKKTYFTTNLKTCSKRICYHNVLQWFKPLEITTSVMKVQ